MDHTTLVHSAKSDGTGVPSGRSIHGRRDERSIRYTPADRPSHRAAAVLLFLLATGSVFAVRVVAQDLQFHQRPSSIRGTVINGSTREPIGHALVYSQDNRFATWTDGDGHFDYPLPKTITDEVNASGVAGQSYPQFTFCCVQARKPGFLSDPDEAQGVEMTLGGEPTIALIPEGLIKGRVSLPSSDAAFGIDIDLFSRQVQNGTFRWVRSLAVRANSKGEFRFAELLPGEYKLVTHELMDTDPSALLPGRQPYGFPPVYFPGAPDLTSASPIQLKAGQTFEAALLLVRQPYYQVRIPVADDIENAAIAVSVQGHDRPGYTTRKRR